MISNKSRPNPDDWLCVALCLSSMAWSPPGFLALALFLLLLFAGDGWCGASSSRRPPADFFAFPGKESGWGAPWALDCLPALRSDGFKGNKIGILVDRWQARHFRITRLWASPPPWAIRAVSSLPPRFLRWDRDFFMGSTTTQVWEVDPGIGIVPQAWHEPLTSAFLNLMSLSATKSWRSRMSCAEVDGAVLA